VTGSRRAVATMDDGDQRVPPGAELTLPAKSASPRALKIGAGTASDGLAGILVITPFLHFVRFMEVS
jgi:hypothetical protein